MQEDAAGTASAAAREAGPRAANATNWPRAFMAQGFGGQVIGFDSACAAGYAIVRNAREAIGQPVTIPDP
jgi:hypothetical protein